MAMAASGAASGNPDGLASPLSCISPASTVLKLDAAGAWLPPPLRVAGLPVDEMDGEDGCTGAVEAPCSMEGLSMALFLFIVVLLSEYCCEPFRYIGFACSDGCPECA
jgi:hypothetical protein